MEAGGDGAGERARREVGGERADRLAGVEDEQRLAVRAVLLDQVERVGAALAGAAAASSSIAAWPS